MAEAFPNPLDSYARQARLFPGLLTLFPPVLAVLAWFPYLIISSIGATILTLATSCGLLYALASFARTKGKEVERRLLLVWGGWPTTHLLRHSGALDATTRARYHAVLIANVPDLKLPTAAEEAAEPAAADALYASAINWLKEHARGRDFPLVEKENAQYGFRRNLLGLKSLGITINVIVVILSLVVLLAPTLLVPTTLEAAVIQASERSAVWAAILVNVLAIAAWLRIVNDAWVREAADQYASRLLAALERLGKPSTTSGLRRAAS